MNSSWSRSLLVVLVAVMAGSGWLVGRLVEPPDRAFLLGMMSGILLTLPACLGGMMVLAAETYPRAPAERASELQDDQTTRQERTASYEMRTEELGPVIIGGEEPRREGQQSGSPYHAQW